MATRARKETRAKGIGGNNTSIGVYMTGHLQCFTLKGIDLELTDRQMLFCQKYVELKFNGTRAVIASGGSKNPNVAKGMATRLLTYDNIKRYVELLKNDISLAIGISACDIAREYAKIGFAAMPKKLVVSEKIQALDKLAKMIGADGVLKIAKTDTNGNQPVFFDLGGGETIDLNS